MIDSRRALHEIARCVNVGCGSAVIKIGVLFIWCAISMRLVMPRLPTSKRAGGSHVRYADVPFRGG